MKIVLTDAQTVLDDIVNADVLNRFGEVESFGLLKYEEVAEKIADADIVVCNKTLLDSHTMRFAKNLKYIGLFATGYNNIDLDYCTKNGITVCNAGSYSTNAVAQHTFADDGTFSGEMSGVTVSGNYTFEGTDLVMTVGEQQFNYTYDADNDMLKYTDPNTGLSSYCERQQ